MSYTLAYITASGQAEAQKIGQILVEKKLAACVNIFTGMQSMYMWQRKLEKSSEAVIIAKTTEDLQDRLVEQVKKIHSYECPCVVFLPVTDGNPEFLQWIGEETAS
ncbi:MAG: divalent-cation tolerance protein CutA [Desulfonatronovibrio sp.]|nr:divalent-cation tolerance protein CutA [Desulfovibrionales bacterium]